jgi:hypothetical protein
MSSPVQEIVWYLETSPAVRERLYRDDIARAFGLYLAMPESQHGLIEPSGHLDLDAVHVLVDLYDRGDVTVLVTARGDGGYSMALAEEVDT